MTAWTPYAVGSNQIVQKGTRNGNDIWEMTTARDEPCGQWGDGNGGQFRKRAQYREPVNHAYGAVISRSFSTCIPLDWESSLHESVIWDIHQHAVSLQAGSPALLIGAGGLVVDDYSRNCRTGGMDLGALQRQRPAYASAGFSLSP